MTEEIEAQAQTIDHICHCEAPTGPWQSVPCAGTSTPQRSYKHARGRGSKGRVHVFAGANTKRLPFVSFFSPFFLDKQKEWAPRREGQCIAEDECLHKVRIAASLRSSQ